MTEFKIEPMTRDRLESLCSSIKQDANITGLLDRTLGFPLTFSVLLRQSFEDPDFSPDLFLALLEGDSVIGGALAIQRAWKKGPEVGWIKFVYINPPYRRQQWGSKLLTTLETRLSAKGANSLLFGSSSPHYLFPGLPQELSGTPSFFKAHEWQITSERTNLLLEISKDADYRERLEVKLKLNPSYRLVTIDASNFTRVVDFISKEVSISWAREIGPIAEKTPGSVGSFLENNSTGEIIGFEAVGATNPNWLGPMGVRKEDRRKGLGAILALQAAVQAQEAGITTLIIPWVSQTNILFYGNVIGAIIGAQFWKLDKN